MAEPLYSVHWGHGMPTVLASGNVYVEQMGRHADNTVYTAHIKKAVRSGSPRDCTAAACSGHTAAVCSAAAHGHGPPGRLQHVASNVLGVSTCLHCQRWGRA